LCAVIIGCSNEVIARRRSYAKADMIFDPLHFLPLIEQKVGALDPGSTFAGLLAGCLRHALHRLLEARMGKPGNGNTWILRLRKPSRWMLFRRNQPTIDLEFDRYDAVKRALLCRVEKRRPPRADRTSYPYLPRPTWG
jgi:hypothetical protein